MLLEMDKDFTLEIETHPDGELLGFYDGVCRRAIGRSFDDVEHIDVNAIKVSMDVFVALQRYVKEKLSPDGYSTEFFKTVMKHFPSVGDNLKGMQIRVEDGAIRLKEAAPCP